MREAEEEEEGQVGQRRRELPLEGCGERSAAAMRASEGAERSAGSAAAAAASTASDDLSPSPSPRPPTNRRPVPPTGYDPDVPHRTAPHRAPYRAMPDPRLHSLHRFTTTSTHR